MEANLTNGALRMNLPITYDWYSDQLKQADGTVFHPLNLEREELIDFLDRINMFDMLVEALVEIRNGSNVPEARAQFVLDKIRGHK